MSSIETAVPPQGTSAAGRLRRGTLLASGAVLTLGAAAIHLAGTPGPHETWEGAFLADNPGLWMLHCHVLIHAAFGLSPMVSYEGITTPHVIGSKSGNFPE